MEDIHTFYKSRIIEMYNTLKFFKNNDIPIEKKFWENIKISLQKIQNGLEYNPFVIRGTGGLHAELSISPSYNPFQTAYDKIKSENLKGWHNRVNLPNAFSGTSYYMFRLLETYYLVWINSHGEICEVSDGSWISEIKDDEFKDEYFKPIP